MPDLYLDLDYRLRADARSGVSRFSQELHGTSVLDGFRMRDRNAGDVRWLSADRSPEGLVLRGEIPDRWRVLVEISVTGSQAPRALWSVEARSLSPEAVETGFDISWEAAIPEAEPFVPGLFYGENRPSGKGNCPRWCRTLETGDQASSPFWRFRTDRTMTPFAMLRNATTCAAVSTPETFSHGASGIGFCADANSQSLTLHFPYREEPVKHVFFEPEGNAPVVYPFVAGPGETVSFQFETFVGEAGWRPLLRDMYVDSIHDLNPWIPGAEAADLAAMGLFQWHFDPEHRVLYETAGFDRYFSRHSHQVDRPHMHVAWVSGIPYAYALLRHGVRTGEIGFEEAGLTVIDRVCRDGLAPAGMFYPQWTEEDGWTTGWHHENPAPPYAQSRTVAEATWFLLQALISPEPWETGNRLALWSRAARSNLDYALSIQREDGSFGTYYNLETGEVEEWEGTGGIMWIPALLAGARYWDPMSGARFLKADAYREAAVRAGEYYASFVLKERLFGAPEDVPYAVTSEDGYNALIAMLHLYEATGDEKWCDLAAHAADYALSFRMSYNSSFAETTLLGQYDFRTKGADIASPSNQHLHNYGLICVPAMLRLWRLTGDDYYFSRARDHLFCFRQFVARADGDFNARRGMVPEQWFHTDWTHPKGGVLPLAHSWCAGWIVMIEDWLSDWGNLFLDPAQKRHYCLEVVDVLDVDWVAGTVKIANPWSRDLDLKVFNLVSEERSVFHLPAGQIQLFQF